MQKGIRRLIALSLLSMAMTFSSASLTLPQESIHQPAEAFALIVDWLFTNERVRPFRDLLIARIVLSSPPTPTPERIDFRGKILRMLQQDPEFLEHVIQVLSRAGLFLPSDLVARPRVQEIAFPLVPFRTSTLLSKTFPSFLPDLLTAAMRLNIPLVVEGSLTKPTELIAPEDGIFFQGTIGVPSLFVRTILAPDIGTLHVSLIWEDASFDLDLAIYSEGGELLCQSISTRSISETCVVEEWYGGVFYRVIHYKSGQGAVDSRGAQDVY